MIGLPANGRWRLRPNHVGMALCDDLKAVETELERSIARATDVEQLVRLNASLLSIVNRRAVRNAAMLERICNELGIDYSDLSLVKK